MEKEVNVTGEETKDVSSVAAPEGTEKGAESPAEEKPAVKTYDQAYIDKLLQDQEAARKAAVEEALKVAGMDEASKESYEKEKAAKDLADRESAIAKRELRADAREVLAKSNVSDQFLDILIGNDLKETEENVASFRKVFDAAVQEQVEKRLAGKTPSGGNSGGQSEADAIAAEIDKYMV